MGHPDESLKKSKLKKEIVGYVEKIIPLDDGIAVLCTYDDEHYEKILKKELRSMSPRWKTLALDNGSFMPIELISIGLTNEPNIDSSGEILSPSKALLQEKYSEENLYIKSTLRREIKSGILNSKNCINAINKIKDIQDSLKESISKKLISSALNNGSISVNDCHKWANEFKQSYDKTKRKLMMTPPKKDSLSSKEIVSLTKEKMQAKSLSWDEAFKLVNKENSLI